MINPFPNPAKNPGFSVSFEFSVGITGEGTHWERGVGLKLDLEGFFEIIEDLQQRSRLQAVFRTLCQTPMFGSWCHPSADQKGSCFFFLRGRMVNISI